MPAPRPPARPEPAPQFPMRDLLASCAAAKAISTPPPAPDPASVEHAPAHRKAA
ncbi:hypothetical protein [Streptomyces sp. NRRL F-2799]|uniref:hypothetical protein n=1 Tax=Streptomyces sp. NRRL F-2799 TaxID=1463844 RepID=UPI000A40C242|nr:hypothetical protein [Streptomyces sp. NRRL F-2799]